MPRTLLPARRQSYSTEFDHDGIHYHAFIDGKHHWVCEACKKKLKIDAEHMDD